MGWKSALIKPYAAYISRRIDRMAKNAVRDQHAIRRQIVEKARDTIYGRDHHFGDIRSYEDFKAAVPIHDYEGGRLYFDRVKDGEKDVLWPGKPTYFAKTSGTTSGIKYIPITRDSLPNHFETARNALLHYGIKTGNLDFIDGKLIFLSGSPKLDQTNGILTGRLSGIVNHQVPGWLKKSQVPSWETNCIEDWETKVDRIVDETRQIDLRLISGIPPWVQMYYEKLLAATGKSTVLEQFPNFSVFVYGGVNFEPYRNQLEALTGGRIDSVETYPASEGFIAFQDAYPHAGMLLNSRSGIFFEFVPAREFGTENARRLALEEVETGTDYVLIINSNAGLWGYNLGDTIRFVSTDPYRVVVTGRIKHFISAFGEHVIGKEIELALSETLKKWPAEVVELTVAPQVNPEEGLPYHEWFIEFGREPEDLEAFQADLDREMVRQNAYYEDLIVGHILRPLVVTRLAPEAFRNLMKARGKLGGQNKVPRLANDREIAAILEQYRLGD